MSQSDFLGLFDSDFRAVVSGGSGGRREAFRVLIEGENRAGLSVDIVVVFNLTVIEFDFELSNAVVDFFAGLREGHVARRELCVSQSDALSLCERDSVDGRRRRSGGVGRGGLVFREGQDADVAEFNGIAVSEEADEAGLVVEAGVFGVVDRLGVRNIGVDDDFAVDGYFNLRTDRDDFFVVPFANRLEGAGFGGDDAVDAAVTLPFGDSRIVFVDDLNLHAVVGGVEIRGGRTDSNAVVAVLREFEFETEDEVGIRFLCFKVAALFADEISVLNRVAVDPALPDFRAEGISVEEEFETEFFFKRSKLVQRLVFLRVDEGSDRANACDKSRDKKLFHNLFPCEKGTYVGKASRNVEPIARSGTRIGARDARSSNLIIERRQNWSR